MFINVVNKFKEQVETVKKHWNIENNVKTFAGRQKEIDILAKYCVPPEKPEAKRKIFVISGIGGIGKPAC